MGTRLSMALQTIKSLEARNGALMQRIAELEELLKGVSFGEETHASISSESEDCQEGFKSRSEQRRMKIQKGEED